MTLSTHEPSTPADSASGRSLASGRGLEAADEAFHVVRSGTSRLVQLLADELVPLAPDTVEEIDHTVERLRSAVPALAYWRTDQASDQTAGDEWSFEPPFARVGVRLAVPDDLDDLENVERLRRSFDLLAPRSLALRKEVAALVVDALLQHLRR